MNLDQYKRECWEMCVREWIAGTPLWHIMLCKPYLSIKHLFKTINAFW